MLERTRYLLVSELAMSRNVEETVIEDVLDRALTKSKLRFPDASAVAVLIQWIGFASRRGILRAFCFWGLRRQASVTQPILRRRSR